MKIIIANPPWITQKKLGFRANVRWPFMISQREFKLQQKALYHFPLYHAYAAAVLQNDGFRVGVLDAAVDCLDIEDFITQIEIENPDFIILEISTPSFDIDMTTVKQLKKKLDLPLALVGSHATVFHREILEQNPAVDIIIRGEFEETILEIARAFSLNNSLDHVKGITYRENGQIVQNESRLFISDLDSMPFPARELYPWQRYHEPVYVALPWITMISSRGCPFQCIFCSWPQTMYGHRFRKRNPRCVVDEIDYCLRQYQPGEFFFDDDTFTTDKRHVMEICRHIIERKLNIIWSCMGRIDTVDYESLELMAGAGCRRLKFGVETGSPDIMKTIRKNIDLTRIKEIVEFAQRLGIKIHGTFMIGLPGETRQTIEHTINFALDLKLDSAQFSIATPFPGTEFFTLAEKNDWLITRDWDKFDGASGSVISYPQLSKKEIDTYLSVAWTRLYSEQKDLISLIRKTLNKIRDQGLLETYKIARTYFQHSKEKTR